MDLTPANIDRTRRHSRLVRPPGRGAGRCRRGTTVRSGTFDAVYSNGVLHHLEVPERGFEEVARVLRPGGEAWIIVYHQNSVFYWLTLFLFRWILRGEFRRYRSFARPTRDDRAHDERCPACRPFLHEEAAAFGTEGCGSGPGGNQGPEAHTRRPPTLRPGHQALVSRSPIGARSRRSTVRLVSDRPRTEALVTRTLA